MIESCTALAEHFDGTLELVYWTEERGLEFPASGRMPEESPEMAM